MKIVRGNGGRVDSKEQTPVFYPEGVPILFKKKDGSIAHLGWTLGIGNFMADDIIELSECPCDPRRRHERLGQKVAVI